MSQIVAHQTLPSPPFTQQLRPTNLSYLNVICSGMFIYLQTLTVPNVLSYEMFLHRAKGREAATN
jgi:hypothetical protein